jgi:hypothetical protein
MSDQEDRDPHPADEANDPGLAEEGDAGEQSESTQSDPPRLIIARRTDEERSAGLPLVLPPSFWEKANDSRNASWAGALGRHGVAVAALTVGVVALGAAVFVAVDHHRQAGLLAERAQENARLAETVSALNTRLQTIEAAKGRDEFAELRRSVGEMKTAAVSSRELSAAIAQLSQRVEKLDREQGAKLDKLGERVGHETNARAAEIAARLDKLEKTPAPPPSPPAPAAQPPKFAANVSMDPTGSIDRSRQVLRGYVVLGAENDTALIGGRYGERAVRAGDYLPGAGRVERVERQGANWVVLTEQGLIASAYAAPF